MVGSDNTHWDPNGYYTDPQIAPYIDHLHTTIDSSGNWIFGTTGHTNNHDNLHNGYAPMVFKVNLDSCGNLDTSTAIVREIRASEFHYESYITGVRD